MHVTLEAHDFLLSLSERQKKYTVRIAYRGNKR